MYVMLRQACCGKMKWRCAHAAHKHLALAAPLCIKPARHRGGAHQRKHAARNLKAAGWRREWLSVINGSA